jgi:hypothetical protein
MSDLRKFATGLMTLTLAVGGATGATAQSDVDTDSGAVVVTGTLECLDSDTPDAAAGQSVVSLHAWEADDERLAGDVAYSGRWALYEEPSAARDSTAVGPEDAVYQIVNDGGSWLCTETRGPEPRSPDTGHTLIFSGEGGYEGMTAYLHVDWSQSPYHFSGLILEGDEPPYAEPQG